MNFETVSSVACVCTYVTGRRVLGIKIEGTTADTVVLVVSNVSCSI